MSSDKSANKKAELNPPIVSPISHIITIPQFSEKNLPIRMWSRIFLFGLVLISNIFFGYFGYLLISQPSLNFIWLAIDIAILIVLNILAFSILIQNHNNLRFSLFADSPFLYYSILQYSIRIYKKKYPLEFGMNFRVILHSIIVNKTRISLDVKQYPMLALQYPNKKPIFLESSGYLEDPIKIATRLNKMLYRAQVLSQDRDHQSLQVEEPQLEVAIKCRKNRIVKRWNIGSTIIIVIMIIVALII
jgi:hypothetical protein